MAVFSTIYPNMPQFAVLSVMQVLDECSTCILSLSISLDKGTAHYLPQKLLDLGIDGRTASQHPFYSPSKTFTNIFQHCTVLGHQFSCVLLPSSRTQDRLTHSVVDSWHTDELGGPNNCYILLQLQNISRSGATLPYSYTIKLPIQIS